MIDRTNGNILEIACGTGRIALPLSLYTRRPLYAFDLSQQMLAVFAEKIAASDPEKIKNLHVACNDMTNFSYGEKFGLIILIWRSFQHLTDINDARKCIENIRRHMRDDALLLFSIFLPRASYGADWTGRQTLTYDITHPQTGERIKRYTINVEADENRQIIKYLSCYDIYAPDGAHYHFEDPIIYRYYYPDQIKKLLGEHGFEIAEERKSYGDAGEDQTDQIYILRKK